MKKKETGAVLELIGKLRDVRGTNFCNDILIGLTVITAPISIAG